MHPELFTIGPITIYSFGLMLGIGFLCADRVLALELQRKNHFPENAWIIIFFAIVFGVSGSKILNLIENWSEFLASPWRMATSPGGLTWYGGFFLATLAIYLFVRKKGMNFGKVCDAAAPGLALAYGVARIGCHLAGDGDYGIPTNLPWACEYSKGTFPPSASFKEFPEMVAKYGVNGVVPDNILVHPVPLYECVLGIAAFSILWSLRKKPWADYRIFMLYLILAGLSRFSVEFLRLNPRYIFGLSEAQLIALPLILIGVAGFVRLGGSSEPAAIFNS